LETPPLVSASGPVLIFGGPYSNLEATSAVLVEAKRRGIQPDHIICTGDLAAYCGDPVETIDLIRQSGVLVVMGNCDEQLGAGADDCGCGFAPGTACQQLSIGCFSYASAHVGSEARRWLARLPRRINLEFDGCRLAVIHGSVSTINQFVFASSPASIKARELDLADCDGVIGGHCGLPFTQIVGGRLWHNGGVVGLPANDGKPGGWFSLIVPIDGGLQIEHRALSYDHAGAAESMLHNGLPPEYRITLSTGIWPSCDVLPYREIRDRGVPLSPGACVWRPVKPLRKPRRGQEIATTLLWPSKETGRQQLDTRKFKDPNLTAANEARAKVPLLALKTLWFNTGTRCNITCRNCYIESSPRNDQLVYLDVADIRPYLDEISRDRLGTEEIGFTGGEPFMNPAIVALLEESLSRGFCVLVLTNAMKPMRRWSKQLIDLNARFGDQLKIRVSLDHYTRDRHEEERGVDTFAATKDGLVWLARNGFNIAVAGRAMWGEDQAAQRAGYARLFAEHDIPVDAENSTDLVLFPEMDAGADVPEITDGCWNILGKSPAAVMCATSRMVVKRKGADHPVVLSCTLVPYEPQFELGRTLRDASVTVPLNHPYCAQFCVLGGASCSPGVSLSDISACETDIAA
jgi:predicted phosphodiesterase/pyruvate-formate lyase-activating enzyme